MAFSYIMRFSLKKGLIDRESFVAQYIALALFTIGVASTIGADDLLAAFAAGNFSLSIQMFLLKFLKAAQSHGMVISTSTPRMKFSPPSSTWF